MKTLPQNNRDASMEFQIVSLVRIVNFINCINFNFDYDVMNNKNNGYSYEEMRENKHFCSGYFPSFITIHNPIYDTLSHNNPSGNISNKYYLKIKNGRYLKQISNENSKYNIEYENNMKARRQSIKDKHFKNKT